MVDRAPAGDEDPQQTPGIRRTSLQSRGRLRLPPGESGYQDQEIQRTQHRRRRNLDPLRRRNRATLSSRRAACYSVSDALLLLLRSPSRDSRTSFVGRCKVRRTTGDCSPVQRQEPKALSRYFIRERPGMAETLRPEERFSPRPGNVDKPPGSDFWLAEPYRYPKAYSSGGATRRSHPTR